MTALEYMEKQLLKHRVNLKRATDRNAPAHEIENIKNKIIYYGKAVDALATEPKSCIGCKHYDKPFTIDPCVKCFNYNKFERGDEGK